MDKMSIKELILNNENIELKIHNLQSSIEYFRALLAVPDEIILKSIESVKNRTIDITGEYTFQTQRFINSFPVYSVPGPRNTIIEISYDYKSVIIYYRGTIIANPDAFLINGSCASIMFDDIYYRIADLKFPPKVPSLWNDNIEYGIFYNKKCVFAKGCIIMRPTSDKKRAFIVDNEFIGYMIDAKGKIIHKYHAAILRELYYGYENVFILSDDISICFIIPEHINISTYHVIQPI